jgi:hypothetical protein
MTVITLYTHERGGAGLTSTDVCRVKGAVELQVVSEGELCEYQIKDGLSDASTITTYKEVSPIAGKAYLRLRTTEADIDLAGRKWAVALVVSRRDETTIYWLRDGLCSAIEPAPTWTVARVKIEGRCSPAEFELPPPG